MQTGKVMKHLEQISVRCWPRPALILVTDVSTRKMVLTPISTAYSKWLSRNTVTADLNFFSLRDVTACSLQTRSGPWCHPPYGPIHLLKHSDVTRITQAVASKPHGPDQPPRTSSNVTDTIGSGFIANLAFDVARFSGLLAHWSPQSPSIPAPTDAKNRKIDGWHVVSLWLYQCRYSWVITRHQICIPSLGLRVSDHFYHLPVKRLRACRELGREGAESFPRAFAPVCGMGRVGEAVPGRGSDPSFTRKASQNSVRPLARNANRPTF
jgi:hypothetical protein